MRILFLFASLLCVPASFPALAAEPAATVSPAPAEALDSKTLLREFQQAQRAELKALEHLQRHEAREMKASQKARRREWENQEKQARHKYFATEPKGPEKRAYVQDFIKRREALLAIFADEKAKKQQEHESRLKQLKEEQADRLRQFKESLEKGERPPERLWPERGR